MKHTISIWILTLLMLGTSLVFTNCKKDISKKDPVITWANPSDISFATLLSNTQLNATANVPGTFVYTPPIGTKLNIGINQDLKVDFTPIDATAYNSISKTVKINVTINQYTDPVIIWANPSDISFGSLLSNTQLNATANVAGSFVYTPPVGTKLNIGINQDLKVDFTPVDSTTYNKISKTVKINVTADIVTDIDGNVYHIVTLGTQIWMVENLRTTKYNDSTAIQYNERWGGEAPACYCWYNNDTANKVAYGALYSWYAVNTGKLAPTGWHVPTDAEWTILENFLMTNSYNYDGTTTGNKIAKALSSPTGWHSSTITGSVGNTDYPEKCNTTGFTALPVGGREQQENNWASGKFLGFGYSGYWWSSSETVPQIYGAHGRGLEYDKILLINFQTRREWGFSVRCLRD